ncbi:MAG: DUF1080 domain-containing protein [Planctomycetaceae bacterium]
MHFTKLLAAVLLTSTLAFAQDRIAISDPAKVDEDFAFQGEYSGLTLRDDNVLQTIGLQVIARGSGQFDAVAHMGGLPGQGAGLTKVDLKGERNDSSLQLTSDNLSVQIADRQATVFSAAGNKLGSFFQVQRTSPTLGKTPPPGAIVLFNGTNTEEFVKGKMTEAGLLKEGTQIKRTPRDFTLHLEFRLPYMPNSKGQKRGNSGVYIQSRYEVQILDSFGLPGVKNECGALYRYKAPDVNMCLPPLSWQTYDITFYSPRFDVNGNKYQNARITVLHNGYPVHNNFSIERKTGAGKKEGPELLLTKLQNHSDPVRFRNIWMVEHNVSQPCNCPPMIGATLPPNSVAIAE